MLSAFFELLHCLVCRILHQCPDKGHRKITHFRHKLARYNWPHSLSVRPDVLNAKYHVITNATYSCHNRDPVPVKFKRSRVNSAQNQLGPNQVGPKPTRPKTNSAQNQLGPKLTRPWITRSFYSILLFSSSSFFFFFFHHLYYALGIYFPYRSVNPPRVKPKNFGNLEHCNFQTVTLM